MNVALAELWQSARCCLASVPLFPGVFISWFHWDRVWHCNKVGAFAYVEFTQPSARVQGTASEFSFVLQCRNSGSWLHSTSRHNLQWHMKKRAGQLAELVVTGRRGSCRGRHTQPASSDFFSNKPSSQVWIQQLKIAFLSLIRRRKNSTEATPVVLTISQPDNSISATSHVKPLEMYQADLCRAITLSYSLARYPLGSQISGSLLRKQSN